MLVKDFLLAYGKKVLFVLSKLWLVLLPLIKGFWSWAEKQAQKEKSSNSLGLSGKPSSSGGSLFRKRTNTIFDRARVSSNGFSGKVFMPSSTIFLKR